VFQAPPFRDPPFSGFFPRKQVFLIFPPPPLFWIPFVFLYRGGRRPLGFSGPPASHLISRAPVLAFYLSFPAFLIDLLENISFSSLRTHCPKTFGFLFLLFFLITATFFPMRLFLSCSFDSLIFCTSFFFPNQVPVGSWGFYLLPLSPSLFFSTSSKTPSTPFLILFPFDFLLDGQAS